MRIRGVAAIAALIAHLAGAGGGLLYLCRMDGRVRTACCCPEGDRRPAAERASMSAACCCEVSAVEPAGVAGPCERRAADEPAASLAASAVLPAASPGAITAWHASPDPSPGGKPRLYLAIRTLII